MATRFFDWAAHLVLGLAVVGMAACGDSSSSTTTQGKADSGVDQADTAGGDTAVDEDTGKTEEDTAVTEDTTVTEDTDKPAEPSCAEYCKAVTAACTGANAQYKDAAQCTAICAALAKLPLGTSADTAGNTVGCRTYHAGAAAKDEEAAKTHCPHAGPSGGGVCGLPCDLYCHVAETNCTGDNQVYADHAACVTACAAIKDIGKAGDTAGDTLACRIYHLSVAGGGADAAKTHCPHGAPDGGGVCVAAACSCDGKECGDDGCGKSCGHCADGKTCGADGKCGDSKPVDCGACYEGTTCNTQSGVCQGGTCGDIDYDGICWDEGKAVVFCGGDQLISKQCADGCEVSDGYADCKCTPSCDGKDCGSDGCGGTCGTCADGSGCSKGKCEACSCDGKECGYDACGKSCGDCKEGTGCSDNKCVAASCAGKCDGPGVGGCWCDAFCVKNGDCCTDFCTACIADFAEECKICDGGCTGKSCGEDCFGNACGEGCKDGEKCTDAGACCTPTCDGTTCGDDGCGGKCYCQGGDECNAESKCEPCVPECEGKVCGYDGCDGDCGECDAGLDCSDAGQCVKATCAGACDGQSNGECWCDSYCFENGDCCADACTECGADVLKTECDACTESCKDLTCGPAANGCPGECGTCPEGQTCTEGKCAAP